MRGSLAKKVLLCSILLAAWGIGGRGSTGAELSPEEIQRAFYPYAQGKPTIPELPPGSVLSKDNWELGKDVLPPELLDKVKAGEVEIRTQETTDLPVSEAYIEATKKYAGQVRLGEDGELEGYVAGQPFPLLDPADPHGGVKAVWNFRYRDFGNAAQAWGNFQSVQESGKVDREMEFYYVTAYGMHRPPGSDGSNPNRWEEEGILYKEFYQFLAPFDLKNTMSLKHRYDDDRKRDDDWSYMPSTRKIRKLIVRHEDTILDTDLLNEDFYGFSGYIHVYNWKLLGTKRLLVPAGARTASATCGGRGGWYPVDPWELREMVILEGTPKDTNHPYGRRVLYIDQQMYVPIYTLIYDSQGKHRKTLFTVYGNPKYNPGNEHVRVPVWLGESMIDYQSEHASITLITKVVHNAEVPDDFFKLDKMVARGR